MMWMLVMLANKANSDEGGSFIPQDTIWQTCQTSPNLQQ
jgi:hypothetical protein